MLFCSSGFVFSQKLQFIKSSLPCAFIEDLWKDRLAVQVQVMLSNLQITVEEALELLSFSCVNHMYHLGFLIERKEGA